MRPLAVVMAGGAGTRFWPLSRRSQPKQLLKLFGDRSMIGMTLERIDPVVGGDGTLIVTERRIVEAVRAEAPTVPPENVLAEPRGRNTAPCVALAAVVARERHGPERVLAVLPADHYIGDEERFHNAFHSAVAYAEQGHLVTLGITPTRPETGYGYLKIGEFAPVVDGAPDRARRLVAFVEKPTPNQALAYLREGRYLWNSGMFFFRVDAILEEFREHQPEILDRMEQLVPTIDTPDFDAALEEAYREVVSISLDYGIMEHSERLLTLPSSFGWSDVGSWRAVLDLGGEEGVFRHGHVICEDTESSVLVAGEGVSVVTLGVRDLAVVACGDVTLVVHLDRAQEVRDLVDQLRRKGLDNLLE